MLQSPKFWYNNKGFWSILLSPLGFLYNAISQLRHCIATPVQQSIPVLCIGNLTIGGSGKTPVAISLCEILKQHGKNPHFISRGYGGSYKEKYVQVNPEHHLPSYVGDEPFLLAAHAPTWVSSDRNIAISEAKKNGADMIILDDGFQNPNLAKDISIVVVDGKKGFGNGCVFPAGPLRESVKDGLKRANFIIVLGGDLPLKDIKLPLVKATIIPKEHSLKGKMVIAFAGIGLPDKFFRTLDKEGATVVEKFAFPDHHGYTQKEEKSLSLRAKKKRALLVTTEKDFVKLSPDFKKKVIFLEIYIDWSDKQTLLNLLEPLLDGKKT